MFMVNKASWQLLTDTDGVGDSECCPMCPVGCWMNQGPKLLVQVYKLFK